MPDIHPYLKMAQAVLYTDRTQQPQIDQIKARIEFWKTEAAVVGDTLKLSDFM